MANINTVLATLNAISDKNSIDVFLPSLQRVVKFKPLTAKQQKGFYACIVDNVLFDTKFVLNTYQILKENCTEDIIDNLTIIDRIVILLALRKDALGTQITIDEETGDFDSCLNYAASLSGVPSNAVYKIDNLEIELKVPTIKEQYDMEVELRGNLKETKYMPEEAISEVVINSVALFVESIKSEAENLEYKSFTWVDRLQIIENLPSSVINSIQSYLDSYSNIRENLLQIQRENDTTIEFNVTADFFLRK